MPQLIARPGPSRPPWYPDVAQAGPPQRGHYSWQAIKRVLPALAAVAGVSILLFTLPDGLDTSGRITLVVFLGAVALWVAHPALIALAGGLVITSPRVGTTTMPAGLRTVPWSLLMFMAATAAVSTALATSGAANWLASGLFGPVLDAPQWMFVAVVIVLGVAAHLGVGLGLNRYI